MKLYKILDKEGRSCNGGYAKWNLPTKSADGKWEPGEWMPEIQGELVSHENGYHLCRPEDLIYWLDARIYEVETEGERKEEDSNVVVRRCRLTMRCEGWTKASAILFACWCLRNTPLKDGRKVWDLLKYKNIRGMVYVAERYAKGQVGKEELENARNKAEDTAWKSIWGGGDVDYVVSMASSVLAKDAPRAAAMAAARAAGMTLTFATIRPAARAAAMAAARAAQTKKLLMLLEKDATIRT